MARTKISKINISDEELEDQGLKKDFHEDKRSSNGYIKVSLSAWGASMLNKGMDDKIEEKRRELEQLRKKHAQLEEIEERGLTKKEKKEKKKQKKKDKKEKKRLKNMPESARLLHGEIQNYKNKFHGKKDKDKEKFSGISYKDKAKKAELSEEEIEKRKEEKEQKEFDKKFEEPLALIRENLIDMSGALTDLNDMIQETKESRSRSKHIMLKDLISAKVNLFNARASSARSIAEIQKSRIDLEMKKVKEKGTAGDERTKNIAMMNKFFPQLLASGAFNSKKSKDDDDDKDKKDKKKGKDKFKLKDKGQEDSFNKHVSKLIKNGDIELSPHELAIDMEGKFKPAIMKSFKTGDFQVVALDNNGKIIRDFKDKYPGLLPKKKELNLKWDDEKDIAKCKNTDQTFQVIQVANLY